MTPGTRGPPFGDSRIDPVAVAQELLARPDPSGAEQDPVDAAVLDAAVGAAGDDAPPSSPLGVLAAEVRAGSLSWARVWADPVAHGQSGLDLLAAVMRRTARGA